MIDENRMIGDLIRKARVRKGMKQGELAETIGVTKQAVSQWETGKTRPDNSLWPSLHDTLRIRIYDILRHAKDNGEKSMNITPLEEITDLDTLEDAVDEILKNCQYFIDQAYTHSITKMLRHTLYVVLAFECYSNKSKHSEDDGPVDWSWIAEDIRETVSGNRVDPWPIPRGIELSDSLFAEDGFLLAKQIRWMSFVVGGDLFEDFDEDGYRDGFLQQLAREAENSGMILNAIFPNIENTLTTMYKLALFGLVGVLEQCPSKVTA